MARSSALAGKNSTLGFGSGGALIAEIVDLSWNGRAVDLIDVTNMDSDGGYREFIAGMRDGGSLALALNFLRTEYEDFIDGLESDDPEDYTLDLQSGDAFTLDGFVVNVDVVADLGEEVICRVDIKIDGKPGPIVVPPTPPVADSYYDNFVGATNTDLIDHTMDSGQSWTYSTFQTPPKRSAILLYATNESAFDSYGESYYWAEEVDSSADYYTLGTFLRAGAGLGGDFFGVLARAIGSGEVGSPTDDLYAFVWKILDNFSNVGRFSLIRWRKATSSGDPEAVLEWQAGSTYEWPLSDEHDMKIEVEGRNVRCYLDSVKVFDLDDYSVDGNGNTYVSSAGSPGITITSNWNTLQSQCKYFESGPLS